MFLRNLFLNTSAIRYDVPDDKGKPEKTDIEKAREAIAKNTVVSSDVVKEEQIKDVDEDEDSDETNEDEPELDADGNPIEKEKEETTEEKEAREKIEAKAAKETRKEQRIQRRIDTAVAAQRLAEAEVIKLKEQLAANPDKKLTEEEVQSKAEIIANEKLAAKELERLQQEFNASCDKLQTAATKIDKEFTPKVVEMTNELGPIPSRLIGILSDLENGPEVLKFLVDDIDEAEKIYDLQKKPEKLAIALIRISDKLVAEAKPKPKEISKVPNPTTPVTGARVKTTMITDADTKPANMDNYVAKRRQQMEDKRKARGY